MGDLKNSPDYSKSVPVTNFFNLRFQHKIYPLIDRPSRNYN